MELEKKMAERGGTLVEKSRTREWLQVWDAMADNEACHGQVGPVLGPPPGWPHPVAACEAGAPI